MRALFRFFRTGDCELQVYTLYTLVVVSLEQFRRGLMMCTGIVDDKRELWYAVS